MLKLLNAQIQVISALTIREIQSQQAQLVYGFGWVIFDAVVSFGGMLVMKLAIRAFNPPGIPPITFLVSGLIPWLMFSAIYHSPDGAIARNRKLLVLPGVTELDLVLGCALRILLTYAILFVPAAVIASYVENVPFPRFVLGIFLLFIATWLMGIGFGFVLMILSRLYAPALKFTGFFLRFSLFFSGVIVQITMFPSYIWPYLSWNPMLHIEELLRTYWFTSYHSPIGSPTYVAECLLGMTFFGLLLERYARHRLPPQ